MNRFVLRLPEELYRRVKAESVRQGLSMNQYLMYNITRIVAAQDAQAFFAERSRGADMRKTLELLDSLPARPPEREEDRMPERVAPRKQASSERARPHATALRSLPPKRPKSAAVAHRVRVPKQP
ncbi:MAG: toxin-antitoxin system HicB family antitoxin [Candidatus Riflebacteria bacterium]|nr:toxin-antitoxin system HicB family antitoxin [Candidatus Riflebacteria bacterium]